MKSRLENATKLGLMASLVAAVALLAVCLAAGCTPSGGEGDSQKNPSVASASTYSVLGAHDALGQKLPDEVAISYGYCAGGSCHGAQGYESLVASTKGYWEGVGQITEANPHASHASNSYACDDCHSLSDSPVNQCNQCHAFESPEGWSDPNPTTSPYGVAKTDSQY